MELHNQATAHGKIVAVIVRSVLSRQGDVSLRHGVAVAYAVFPRDPRSLVLCHHLKVSAATGAAWQSERAAFGEIVKQRAPSANRASANRKVTTRLGCDG